ncbi:hypothetical protein BACI349Y_430022 [Bacillus sp. 349Y]|nr:hypothetical protein BACI349Y_430022 [Bacillus sp. 349Y]
MAEFKDQVSRMGFPYGYFKCLDKRPKIQKMYLCFFVGLGKSSNASKGAHSWADWKGHSKMGEVPDNVRMEMLEKDKQAREALRIAIEERLKK